MKLLYTEYSKGLLCKKTKLEKQFLYIDLQYGFTFVLKYLESNKKL